MTKKTSTNGAQVHTFTTEIGGKPVELTVGKLAKQANCAVTVRMGDTLVLVTATMSRNMREGIDFFPLVVDVEQKMYAVGKIPGSFQRREGRSSESAILNARLIDRGIRPLFPDGFRNDVQVMVTVLSSDREHTPDVLGILGAGAALTLSDIPFAGPFAGVRIGRVDGEWIVNPTHDEMEAGDCDLVVAGTSDAIMMVEAGMNEIPEAEVLQGLALAQAETERLCAWITKMGKTAGKAKIQVAPTAIHADVLAYIQKEGLKAMEKAMSNPDKLARQAACEDLKAELAAKAKGLAASNKVAVALAANPKDLGKAIDAVEEEVFRKLVTEKGIRVDGRKLDEIRAMSSEVDLLPRAHGSGLFTRGQTQVLTALALGPVGDAQKIDTIDPETARRYMHHYNFPSYSVGEVRPNRGPGRREIGHGKLAERALLPVLPKPEEFPYTIRLVSEVLESNGSSSMASTCGSTLALLDGGVPIKAPVAGVAMGLIVHDDRAAILTDIQGIEDHLGDMDFKVTGTEEGITALQMDIKIEGISIELMQAALAQARKGRLEILANMNACIDEPREELSPFAPRIITIKVNPEYIGKLIGPGGKNIKGIAEETGCKIDIEDDGTVHITSSDPAMTAKARQWVERHTREVEVGGLYMGKVVRILNFGAFVELFPGKDGLVHISQLSQERVGKVEDVVAIGDTIPVKVVEVDPQGRVNLTFKGVTDEERQSLGALA